VNERNGVGGEVGENSPQGGGALSVTGLSVSYGAVRAIRDLSFEVRSGEFVGVLGANGAGKSTLLKAISGTVTPLHGEIKFNGSDVRALAPHRLPYLGIAHVPERRRVFKSLTVVDNLMLGGHIHKVSTRSRGLMGQVFELFPRLYERQQQIAGSLSGGEQQMLAVGRALMMGPKLLMLDEPSLGLAPIVVELMFDKFTSIHRDLGISIVLVEQNAAWSLEVIERGLVLEHGRITFSGSSDELAKSSYLRQAYLGVEGR
jgi:branched-chain amino acid transport system ATP-binding protein